jgi:hypothetical protein
VKLTIGFEGEDLEAHEKSELAQELKGLLEQEKGVEEAELHREDPNSMDMGTSVLLAIEAPILAYHVWHVVQDWRKRRKEMPIIILGSPDGGGTFAAPPDDPDLQDRLEGFLRKIGVPPKPPEDDGPGEDEA